MKSETLDELISHVENIHIPKERANHDDPERQSHQLPMSCIFSYTGGPLRIRCKRSRHIERMQRDGYSSRIEKECTPEQLHDRFNFDEDDFASHSQQTPVAEEHLLKMDMANQDQRRIKTGILKATARNQESHKCHCGKSYRSHNGLRNHMLTYHAVRGPPMNPEDS